jgi:hypothetical protein
MRTLHRDPAVSNVPELRAALAHLLIAVRALGLSRRDVRRASLDPAMDRAKRALREEREATR